MANSSFIKKTLESLGKNNKPTYVVMAIAAAKGIFRPTFTMLDKKESPETKKYTALREGLTEIIAIPTYWACGELAAKGANLFKDQKTADMARHNLMFAGVCTAALFVIPGLCSLVINPFTDKIFKKSKPEHKGGPARLDVTSEAEEMPIKSSQISQTGNPLNRVQQYNKVSFATFTNSGMKV